MHIMTSQMEVPGAEYVIVAADAFVLAFHSAADAVMYCLTVQKVRMPSHFRKQ